MTMVTTLSQRTDTYIKYNKYNTYNTYNKRQKNSLCENSEKSEIAAFRHLGFLPENIIASEMILSQLYLRRKVPDCIFSTIHGNVAVEVKRIKNVVHKDTVLNALEKVHTELVRDFDIKIFHIVFQARGIGNRDKVSNVIRDVHGILKKIIPCIPYKMENGVKLYIHVQKVSEHEFENIGYN